MLTSQLDLELEIYMHSLKNPYSGKLAGYPKKTLSGFSLSSVFLLTCINKPISCALNPVHDSCKKKKKKGRNPAVVGIFLLTIGIL